MNIFVLGRYVRHFGHRFTCCAVLATTVVSPGVAFGAVEIQPFAGRTTLAEGDVACKQSAPGTMVGAKIGGISQDIQGGLILASTSANGNCGGKLGVSEFGGYVNIMLSSNGYADNVFGLGLEYSYLSCSVEAPGKKYELCNGNAFGGNLFYRRNLSISDTYVRAKDRMVPSRLVYLVAAAGYRGGAISYDDTSTYTTYSSAIGGPYVSLGLSIVINIDQ